MRLPCWLQPRGHLTCQTAGPQAPQAAVDVLGMHVRNCSGFTCPPCRVPAGSPSASTCPASNGFQCWIPPGMHVQHRWQQ